MGPWAHGPMGSWAHGTMGPWAWIDPGSILDRSWIDPGSILDRSWIDPGPWAHGPIILYYIIFPLLSADAGCYILILIIYYII